MTNPLIFRYLYAESIKFSVEPFQMFLTFLLTGNTTKTGILQSLIF